MVLDINSSLPLQLFKEAPRMQPRAIFTRKGNPKKKKRKEKWKGVKKEKEGRRVGEMYKDRRDEGKKPRGSHPPKACGMWQSKNMVH